MNARIQAPRPEPRVDHQHDPDLEREAIGVALLGYPWPDWLSVDHFAAEKHRWVADAVRALGDKANLQTVYSLLREQGRTVQFAENIDSQPWRWTSVELFGLMDEARFAMDMGWAVDFERLRELANQRRLVERMQRLLVKFRHGAVDFDDACGELLEIF